MTQRKEHESNIGILTFHLANTRASWGVGGAVSREFKSEV